jgi:RHS repeat-associated protein
MKFTGHERDLASAGGAGDDLDYMHARHASPLAGRFLAADPVGGNPRNPQSWNRYAYVLDNPLKFTDPYGLFPCPELEEIDCQEEIDVVARDPGPSDFSIQFAKFKAEFEAYKEASLANEGGDFTLQVLRHVANDTRGVARFSEGVAFLASDLYLWGLPSALQALAEGDTEIGIATLAAAAIPGPIDNAGLAAIRAPQRFTPDQQALVALAKEAQRRGATRSEARILREWSNEYGLASRGPESHSGRRFGSQPHLHVGPVNHIPVRGD